MRSRCVLIGVLSASLHAVCVTALAQDQGGGIQGVARDSSGAVLPSVVVSVRGSSMPGVTTTTSDSQGAYRFPTLPPGIYELSAVRAGFTPVNVQDIALRLGNEFRIDLMLQLAGPVETVQVQADSPLIDVHQNATISTIDEESLRLAVPRGRNFTDILTVAAGVQQIRSGISIDGASGPETHYIVNGVKTNDVVIGTNAQSIRLDFVEEIQIKSSGYNAEHGASMGGIVNIITKSGSDEFHGSVGTYYFEPNLRWNGAYREETRISPINNRTPEVFVSQTAARTRSPDYEWLGDFGGPIQRGRLWFYASNSSAYEPNKRTVLFSSATQDGPRTLTNYESNVRVGYALTGVVNSKLRARLTGEMDHARVRRSLPGQMQPDGYTTLANPATRFDLTGEDLPSRLMSANVDYFAGPGFLLNSRVGYAFIDRFDVKDSYSSELRHTFGRSNIGLEGVPPELQFPAGSTSTPLVNSGRLKSQLTRLAWDMSATYFRSWKGQHAIKTGFNAEWVGDDVFRYDCAECFVTVESVVCHTRQSRRAGSIRLLQRVSKWHLWRCSGE
jgi:hypothetical protein